VTYEEVAEAVALCLFESYLCYESKHGEVDSDGFRAMAISAIREIQGLRLTVVVRDE
jgi:hypothetical protein